MKKSNQKPLGENPETPDAPVRPDRKVYDLPDLGLDDAYKVFILIRFLLHPNQMRRRHLESVSSRSLAARESWGTAPSVFWFLLYAQKERPGGEPYRLSPCGDSAPPLGDHKLAPPGRHTDYAFAKDSATPKATTNSP